MELIRQEAIRIALLAGAKIKDLREKKQFEESLKDGYELVTTADLISNEIIKSEIKKIFPTHRFLSEEDSEPKDFSIQEPTWIIDPIDGTVGYANDQYQVAISIAYAFENKVRVGVVYNPFLDEMFYASEGAGAFLNGKPIKVKDIDCLNQCVIGTGFPHKRENLREIMTHLEDLLPKIRDIRRLGSPALDICWVACGRMQGFYEGQLSPWDVAAAKLIAIEAGATAGYYKEKTDLVDCLNGDSVIISSPGVFDEFQRILSGITYTQMKDEIERIVEDACKRDSNAYGYGIWSHHIVLVVKYAKLLAEKLHADAEIVEIAALLHDYAGIKDRTMTEEHHIHGAEEAQKILRSFNYPQEKIQKVKDCILTHRGSVPMIKQSPEAECIASADAMTHVFQVPSLLHLAYVNHGMGIDEGKEWVLKKIERSMKKLCPEAKEMVNEHYLKAKEVLV